MSIVEFKEIGDRTYRLVPFGFDEWFVLSAELADISSPAAGAFASLQMGGEADVGDAIQKLAKAVLTRQKAGTLDRLFSKVSYNAAQLGHKERWVTLKSAKHRDIWSGHYLDGILVLAWVLEVAFKGFWMELTEAVPALSQLLGLAEDRPLESTPED